jgi:hypothetical protein
MRVLLAVVAVFLLLVLVVEPALFTSLGAFRGGVRSFVLGLGAKDSPQRALLELLAVGMGGGWALFLFGQDRRQRAGQSLLALEADCRQLLPTFLAIENSATYVERFATPLQKSIDLQLPRRDGEDRPPELEWAEAEELLKIERVLRHLHICRHVRGAGSYARTIDLAYSYYVQLVNAPEREELREYVRIFWPGLSDWSYLLSRRHPFEREALRRWVGRWQRRVFGFKPPLAVLAPERS